MLKRLVLGIVPQLFYPHILPLSNKYSFPALNHIALLIILRLTLQLLRFQSEVSLSQTKSNVCSREGEACFILPLSECQASDIIIITNSLIIISL